MSPCPRSKDVDPSNGFSWRRPNFSSPFAPAQLTPTALETWHNAYRYNAATLWIAYGLAIGATALAVAGGFTALVANGAAYSDKFSTLFRVSRTAGLSVEVKEVDGRGSDPLPGYLGRARVDLRGVGEGEGLGGKGYELLPGPEGRERPTSLRSDISDEVATRTMSAPP